jgi:hypothetical protein
MQMGRFMHRWAVLLPLGFAPPASAGPLPSADYPAFVASGTARPLRVGDPLRVVRLDDCSLVVPRDEGLVDVVSPDSVVVAYARGRLTLLAGGGDAVASVRVHVAGRVPSSALPFAAYGLLGGGAGMLAGFMLGVSQTPTTEGMQRAVLAGTLAGTAFGVYLGGRAAGAWPHHATEYGLLRLRDGVSLSRCHWTDTPLGPEPAQQAGRQPR